MNGGLVSFVIGAFIGLCLVMAVRAAVTDNTEDPNCTRWQPTLVGKTTALICTEWEDR